MADTYRIVRFYQTGPTKRRVLERGVSYAEAREHCSDPETSSSTATNAEAKRRTKQSGPWFDGFEKEGVRPR